MVKEQKVLCVIPARGGSKRIPKKNIIDFKGKPLLAWTIEAALNCPFITKVIVSTDSTEIANVAVKWGAQVPFLRKNYSDSHSSVILVTIDAIHQLEEEYDVVIQLMPNCPLRTYKDIDEAYDFFITHDHDFQISCFEFGWMNPWWSHTIDGNFVAKPLLNELNKNSQDLPKLYCPTGAIWIAKVQSLLKEQTFYGPNYRFYPMDWLHAIDIDDKKDLDMANITFDFIKKNKE